MPPSFSKILDMPIGGRFLIRLLENVLKRFARAEHGCR